MFGYLLRTGEVDNYVLGKNVTVVTDHKPLEMIFRKSILTSPKRLQRMRLRLQKYDITVCYKKGPHMFISDALSRASLQKPAEDLPAGHGGLQRQWPFSE